MDLKEIRELEEHLYKTLSTDITDGDFILFPKNRIDRVAGTIALGLAYSKPFQRKNEPTMDCYHRLLLPVTTIVSRRIKFGHIVSNSSNDIKQIISDIMIAIEKKQI